MSGLERDVVRPLKQLTFTQGRRSGERLVVLLRAGLDRFEKPDLVVSNRLREAALWAVDSIR